MGEVNGVGHYILADGRAIKLKEGEWCIVNPDMASIAQSVCAVTVRNAPEGMPCFAYFLAGKNIGDLRRDPDLNIFDKEISDVWPYYGEILKRRIELVPDGKGGYANIDEWREAPEPGYFDLAGFAEYWAKNSNEN